jgi:hypothetical protein
VAPPALHLPNHPTHKTLPRAVVKTSNLRWIRFSALPSIASANNQNMTITDLQMHPLILCTNPVNSNPQARVLSVRPRAGEWDNHVISPARRIFRALGTSSPQPSNQHGLRPKVPMPPWVASVPHYTGALRRNGIGRFQSGLKHRSLFRPKLSNLHLRYASAHVSPTAINVQPNIPARNEELYSALSELNKEAEQYVNISRVQLALRNLASQDPVIRIAGMLLCAIELKDGC